MASLFDPLSIAQETVKTIEGVGSHRPDPPRFKVRIPFNPGEWAKKEAFQRQHNLLKWSIYNAKKLSRADFKLPKITAEFSSESTFDVDVGSVDESEKDQKSEKTFYGSKETSFADERDEDYEEEMGYAFEEEEDEESQKMSKMTTNQRRYYAACKLLNVTVNRKVLRFIDHFELILSMMKMTDPEFKAIMAALVTNDIVERLDLKEMRLSDKQVVYLTDFFTEENVITDLILADNNLRGRIMQNFFSTIVQKDRLVYLDIAGNDLRDKDAAMLADYVKVSETLLHLYMSRNNFTEKSGDVFGKMMSENNSLVDLDISANRIRCVGAEKFFKGLSKNTNIQRLDFSWNGLGSEGVKAAISLLKKNTTLIYLNFTGNRISGSDLELFYSALKKNTTLKRFVLSHNPFLTSDITAFLKELYKWTTTGINRIDFGPYQTVDSAAAPLIDLLFLEKNIDIRYGSTLTFSKQTFKCDEVIAKLKDDPLALVTRLKNDERMKLVKYFGQLDLDTAIEEGEVEIGTESFLNKVRTNKVTYRDLANRLKKAGPHPADTIRTVLDMADIAAAPSGRSVPRYSLIPEVARRLYIKSRAEEKMA